MKVSIYPILPNSSGTIGFIPCRKRIVMYKFHPTIAAAIVITAIAVITASESFFVNVYAQTPTTSDLPATIGNNSSMNASLSNNTISSENVTTVTPVSPP